MLMLLSPAKSLNFTTPSPVNEHHKPLFIEEANELVKTLRQLSHHDVAKLMNISSKLAELNCQRYQSFSTTHYDQRAKQALFAYDGDVYQGLDAYSFNENDIMFAEQHLLILSGLYGILRPLDLIQPYRLEMAIKLNTKYGKDLYQFWGDKLTCGINEMIKNHRNKVIVNLASHEYSSAIKPGKLQAKWLKVDFKEQKSGEYKIVAIHAKKARGLMAKFIIQNKADEIEGLKDFNLEGYAYKSKLSSEDDLVFTRKSK